MRDIFHDPWPCILTHIVCLHLNTHFEDKIRENSILENLVKCSIILKKKQQKNSSLKKKKKQEILKEIFFLILGLLVDTDW